MDFVMDGLVSGRGVRALALIDSFSRERCTMTEVYRALA